MLQERSLREKMKRDPLTLTPRAGAGDDVDDGSDTNNRRPTGRRTCSSFSIRRGVAQEARWSAKTGQRWRDFNLFMRQVRQQGFRVHVGVLHIRSSTSLTSLTSSKQASRWASGQASRKNASEGDGGPLPVCLSRRRIWTGLGCWRAPEHGQAGLSITPPLLPLPRRAWGALGGASWTRSIIFLRRQVPRCTRVGPWWSRRADDSAEDGQCFLLR
ncbi:hypothetical protein B0T16DRAFT_186904 [Cercophora newfieldiana]|uniref:Uncharacterized protein n=1 Tax=Cercophora newfieldiana TaxID=92897 RepID=A0AA39Y335_9PEZI|nr:hypothetical protein B0T16DRAFT_186904 [Cercophora newfieldiana]